jgi:hypothetical protein
MGVGSSQDVEDAEDSTYLAADGPTLPTGEREYFDVVCRELKQYPQDAIEVVGCGDVVSYG